MSRSFKAALGAALIALAGISPTTGLAQSRSVVSAGEQPRLVNLPRGSSFAVDLPADARDNQYALFADHILTDRIRLLDPAGRVLVSTRTR